MQSGDYSYPTAIKSIQVRYVGLGIQNLIFAPFKNMHL